MSVRNTRSKPNEKIQYISPDGVKFNLHNWGTEHLLNVSGWGLPSAEIATTRGPFQHGVNPLTIRIPPRNVTLELRHIGCSRDEYWENREDLVNALRLNRTSVNDPSPGSLRWYRSDGEVRQIDVMVMDGPKFDPSPSGIWDEWGYTDVIEFIAHNPVIYNPTRKTASFDDLGCTILSQLQFPFSFSSSMIIFGGSTCNAINSLIVNYLGNWQEYPLITVVGPANNFSIENVDTGLIIELDYNIPAGDSVVFDLTYGVKTVKLVSSGASLLGYITTDSDLGQFALEPDPVVDDGINEFEVSIDNGTGDTRVIFQYFDRYIGM